MPIYPLKIAILFHRPYRAEETKYEAAGDFIVHNLNSKMSILMQLLMFNLNTQYILN
jgi:hypothetical protein